MVEPNPSQKQLIESTEGIYLVDAGAGTGKTFTLTRRYAYILERGDVDPRDILLITFTNNAAEEMKERVINHCDYNALDLQEAPISTFHGLCNRFLLSYGFDSPTLLGLDNHISSSTQILENYTVEQQAFRDFSRRFKDNHPDYRSYLRLYRDPAKLLNLIHSLTAKGIFPTSTGWYQAGERYLDGNWRRFRPYFERVNQPRGDGGTKQSRLKKKMNNYKKRCFHPTAPLPETIREKGPPKQVNPDPFREAFETDREPLKQFVHDLYFEYIDYTLREDYLNFGFLMMFSYVSLCERPSLREQNRYRYVMVDEFQDTSEIQFKLAMLLSDTNNFCAVGDWKQSIYSFQYASVDNIREFSDRLKRYRDELNEEGDRIPYPVDEVQSISLEENYRSLQSILDHSTTALTLSGTRSEDLDEQAIRDSVVDLNANLETEAGEITRLQSDQELQLVLSKITEMVDSEDYQIIDDNGEPRPVRWSDIAVLTRTRNFGLDLQEEARKHGIPIAYEGGVELFGTAPAVMLLAWLRVLDDIRSREGWTVILEEAGDRYDDIRHRLERLNPEQEESLDDPGDILPKRLLNFRQQLVEYDRFLPMIRRVFETYGFRSGVAESIIDVLQRTVDSTYMNRGQLIQFIRRNIEAGTTYEVDDRSSEATVTVQTIHGAKGLEYPVVFVSDMNRDKFPSTGGGYPPPIQYRDPVGLRAKKIFYDEPIPHQYEHWPSYLLFSCLGGEYDEERRLLYVAMTRAKQYLYLTAGTDRPGRFFTGWDEETIPLKRVEDPEIPSVTAPEMEPGSLKIGAPRSPARIKLSPHDLMDESIFQQAEEGSGRLFGKQVHEYAERLLKEELDHWEAPTNSEFRNHAEHVEAFLEELEGETFPEKFCLLPLKIDGDRILIEGVVDLIHVLPDRVQVIDYKTDASRYAQEEYRKQLSLYYHVVTAEYPDKPIELQLFYSAQGTRVNLEPFTRNQLIEQVQAILFAGSPTNLK